MGRNLSCPMLPPFLTLCSCHANIARNAFHPIRLVCPSNLKSKAEVKGGGRGRMAVVYYISLENHPKRNDDGHPYLRNVLTDSR